MKDYSVSVKPMIMITCFLYVRSATVGFIDSALLTVKTFPSVVMIANLALTQRVTV